MNSNNTMFIKGLAYMIGVNLVINLLPHPWGLITFGVIVAHGIYELWRYTR